MLPRRLLPLLLAIGALVLAACGGSDSSSSSSKPTPTPTAKATQAGANPDTGCQPAKPGKTPPKPSKPKGKLDPKKTYTVTVDTNCGSFEIKLAVKKAPKTTNSFVSLVKQRFFDGLKFHRIVPGFVIQGGDPKGDGTGGPGYSVTEAPPSHLQYTAGVVAMAKTGTEPSGTSGSQFFVVTTQNAGLPPQYALLGQVTKGLDVVQSIGAVPTQSDEQPVDPVVIKRMTVKES